MVSRTDRTLVVAAVLVAVAVALGAGAARAQDAPAQLVADPPSMLDEMAWALGFEDSKAAGFEEALSKARAEEREKIEEERVAANEAVIRDALTFGRRITSNDRFVEIVPGPSGDVWSGDVYVRIGSMEIDAATGVIKWTTNYFGPGNAAPVATVESELRGDLEVVTKVRGKTDLVPGDWRPLPDGGESAAGLKPQTLDPVKDGSMGRAAGGGPVKPAEPGGSHWPFDGITLPNGRVLTPWLDVDPTRDLSFANGVDIEEPTWDGAKAVIEALSDKDGKAKGVVGWVSDKGTDTIISVHELEPGGVPGLEPGMTRPTPKAGEPQIWSPEPSSPAKSGGESSGDTPKDPGTGAAAAGDDPKAEPEPAPADSANVWYLDSTHDATYTDGTKWHTEWYKLQGRDLSMQVVTTTQPDGTTDTTTTCYSAAGKQDCPSGMTDEPTCTTDCARAAALAVLFCTQCDEGFNPLENARDDPSKGPRPLLPGGTFTGPISIPYWAWSNPDHALAPKDYGDPSDANRSEPIPYVDPRDGTVDPVEPEVLVDAASESIANDMRGSLYDPVDPRTGDAATGPAGTPPNPGDAEHNG